MKIFVSLSSPELVDEGFTGHRGVYVFVTPVEASIPRILDIAYSLNVRPEESKLHVTVMSSEKAPRNLPHVMPNQVLRSLIDKIEMFDGHDGRTYLVAQLMSDDLQALHRTWARAGAVHMFKPYSPHITLWAGVTRTPELERRIDRVNASLNAKPAFVYLSGETATDLKDD